MERWEACPASVQLSVGTPNKTSQAAAEGTVAHWFAEQALLGGMKVLRLANTIREEAGFKIKFDKTMQEAVIQYKVIVDDLSDADTIRHVEHRFHLATLHPLLFGTSDCVLWHPKRQHLDVIDFKYGKGHVVEAEGNPQLQYYGVGAAMDLGYRPKTVTLHIVQPRAPHKDGPHRWHDLDSVDLIEFALRMVAGVKETEGEDPPVNPGRWCYFCPVGAVPGLCPAKRLKAEQHHLSAASDFSAV